MLNTLEPVDMMYYQNMGQRVGMSFLDVKALNTIYCSGKVISNHFIHLVVWGLRNY